MRLALVLALVLLAGCLSSAAPKTATPGPDASHSALGAWTLDCALGSYEKANNSSWGQTCEARASHNPGPKEETWIAINPTDPLNVVVGAKDLDPASSDKCVWNGVFVTKDGGKTWHDVVIGGKYKDRKPSDATYGYQCNTDPDFQFTKDGALHYGVEMYGLQNLGTPAGGVPVPNTPASGQLSGFKILLATSKDGGLTWPDIITYQADLLYTTDYSRMTIDPVSQAIIEAIGSDGGAGCHVLVSKDGGKSAQPPVEVATPYGPACGSGGNTAIAVSPKGITVLMGGIDANDVRGGPTHPVVVRSTDDGQTWVDSNEGFPYAPVASPFKESKYRVGTNIELAYDLTNGTTRGKLYAAYAAADKDEADVYVRVSGDDGKTWGAPVMVNVPDAAKSHQWMPNIGVAGDGSVHVFYMDKSYDPGHKLIDMVHAVSFDGGKTWANERVSTLSYDGDLGVHQSGFPFIGDYLGVACSVADCWAGFPDASNGATTVVAAAHVHHE